MKKRFFIIPAVLLFIVSPDAESQDWSRPEISPTVPAITFQWRRSEKQKINDLTFLEWRFINTTDSVITCNYLVQSNQGDQRIGRITLTPHKKKLSGWYFAGDEIQRLEFSDVKSSGEGRKSP